MDPEYDKQIKLKYIEERLNELEKMRKENEYLQSNYKFDSYNEFHDTSYDKAWQKLSKSSVAISINKNGNLDVLNSGDGKKLTQEEAITLISKIVSNTSIPNNSTLKLFEPTLEKEVVDFCAELFKKWGVKNNNRRLDFSKLLKYEAGEII